MTEQTNRFEIKLAAGKGREPLYHIIDRLAANYGLPERIGILYLPVKDAQEVCDILNRNWNDFQKNRF